MQLHQLRPIHKQRKSKRVGRGGAHGFQCGKGAKGQKSRASRKFKPIVRDLIKRYPKLRGYKFKGIASNIVVINLEALENKFEKGDIVSPATLIEKRIVRKIKGKVPKIKVLSGGDFKKSLIFEDLKFSKSAEEKIKKSGGEIK